MWFAGTRQTASWLLPIAAVMLALLTVAAILSASSISPVEAFNAMFEAALGGRFQISASIIKSLPRFLPALGIALAIRAGLWNIGAEGQIYIGAVFATAVALYAPAWPFPIVVVLALSAGALGGGLWAAGPGYLRAWRGTNEVITTLMMVYIGIQLTRYFVEEIWAVSGATFPATERFEPHAVLPVVFPGTLLNAGVLVAVACGVLLWFIHRRTTLGVYLSAVGSNESAAQASGVPTKRVTFIALTLSGAFAGVAGAVEVLGVRGRLIEGLSPGYGFEAIAIALLGGLNPIGIAGASLFFGLLDVGGSGLRTSGQDIPSAVVQITASLSVVYLLIGQGLLRRLNARAERRAALASQGVSSSHELGEKGTE